MQHVLPTGYVKSVESRFTARSGSIYDGMKQRFAERKSEKTGRITQIGRPVPFTKEQFRGWLIQKLGGEGGVIKCRFCAAWLTIDDLVLDHADPVSQGGSLDLENLDLLCKLDNDAKGSMCAECYQALLDWSVPGNRQIVNGLHVACRQDMLHRLAIAVSLAAQQRWQIMQRAKKARVSQVPQSAPRTEIDDEDF